MTTFVDTSALFALLVANDRNHRAAAHVWRTLLQEGQRLSATNYVVLETVALLQRRSGMDAVYSLAADTLPLLTVEWVTESLDTAAVAGLLAARRRDLSLVDCVSFEHMRRQGTATAFTFDPHFAEQGFEVLPAKG